MGEYERINNNMSYMKEIYKSPVAELTVFTSTENINVEDEDTLMLAVDGADQNYNDSVTGNIDIDTDFD